MRALSYRLQHSYLNSSSKLWRISKNTQVFQRKAQTKAMKPISTLWKPKLLLMINLMKHCASTQVWAMYVHLPSLVDSGGRALSFRLSAPTSALQTGLSLTTLKQQPAALMGLNISCCEHLCDYIHHSRDTCASTARRKPSKSSTFADPGQRKVGQRGPPCPFVYIITQVLSVHAACLLVSRPLFQLTSSTHSLQYDLQLTSREGRIAPLGMWLLEIPQVRWKSRWIFKKPVVLSQLSGGGAMYLGPFEQGVERWRSGSTSTTTAKSRPCRRLTSTHAFTALLLVDSARPVAESPPVVSMGQTGSTRRTPQKGQGLLILLLVKIFSLTW